MSTTENTNKFKTRVNSRIIGSCIAIAGFGIYLARKLFLKRKRSEQAEFLFSKESSTLFFIGSSLYPLIYSMILYKPVFDDNTSSTTKQVLNKFENEKELSKINAAILCLYLFFNFNDKLYGRKQNFGSIIIAQTAISFRYWHKNNNRKDNNKLENNIFLLTNLLLIIGNCMIWYETYKQIKQKQQSINYKLNEEKRITRIKKSNLSKVLPVIFEQEMTKLKVINNETILVLKTQLINELNNDVDTFLGNYLLREYRIEINDNNYTGLAMIKFKDDKNDNQYIYIAFLIQIIQNGNINMNIDENDMKKKLDCQLNSALES